MVGKGPKALIAITVFAMLAIGVKSGTVICPGRTIKGPCWITQCEPSLNCSNNVCKKSCFTDTNYGWPDGSGNVCESGPNSQDACETLQVEGLLFNHYRSCCATDRVTCLNTWALFPNAASNPRPYTGAAGFNRPCAPST